MEEEKGKKTEEGKIESKKEDEGVITIKKPSLKKINKWKVSAFVIGILFIISLFTNGFSIGNLVSAKSADQVGKETLDYINNELLRGTATATMGEVTEENGLYKSLLTIAGESNYVYMTKDGSLLFVQAIPIGKSLPSTSSTTSSTTPAQVDVGVDDDPVEGDPNAPVTIIEFSDFQCPYCGRFFNQTLPQIREEYINTGKVKLVYRDYPLNFHQYAQKAAEAGECAHEQGMFWEMHDVLFEKQNEWENVGEDKFKEYASELGLDTTQFNDCLDSGKYKDEVQADFSEGSAAGVRGTPAFFINGQLLSGAQPFSAFQAVIDPLLEEG